jgi:hypothetical protein
MWIMLNRTAISKLSWKFDLDKNLLFQHLLYLYNEYPPERIVLQGEVGKLAYAICDKN